MFWKGCVICSIYLRYILGHPVHEKKNWLSHTVIIQGSSDEHSAIHVILTFSRQHNTHGFTGLSSPLYYNCTTVLSNRTYLQGSQKRNQDFSQWKKIIIWHLFKIAYSNVRNCCKLFKKNSFNLLLFKIQTASLTFICSQ